MASYDTLTLSSRAAPLDIMRLHPADMNGFTTDFDFAPPEPSFDGGATGMTPMPFTTSYELDGFSGSFDDPLTYPTNMFEAFLDDTMAMPDSAPTEMDSSKLLGFGNATNKTPVFDGNGQTWPRISAELNGMFCVAEDVFEGDTAGRPLELTCYRRNLFQISGSITVSRTLQYALLDQSRQVPVTELWATLSATESIEGKSTDIIAVPWKTGAAANGVVAEEKTGAAPSTIPIDLLSHQETDDMFVSIPIAWGRLQFKYATANNGRRKGLQQHYRIQINVMGKVEGADTLIAQVQSNAIVVRGRSPKNFDSSKDVPLTERKSDAGHSRVRGGSVASTPAAQQAWMEPALQSGKFYSAQSVQPFDLNFFSAPTPASTEPSHPPAKRKQVSPNSSKRRPPVPATSWTDPSTSLSTATSVPADTNPKPQPIPTTTPFTLSLTDDLHDPNSAFGLNLPPSTTTLPPTSSDTFDSPWGLLGPSASAAVAYATSAPISSSTTTLALPALSPPSETADQLYEYFPLSLDDWMPPVDAIYRPHVVHHLKLPPEVKAMGLGSGVVAAGGGVAGMGRGRVKRYFSEG